MALFRHQNGLASTNVIRQFYQFMRCWYIQTAMAQTSPSICTASPFILSMDIDEVLTIQPVHEVLVYTNNKGSDQPEHMYSFPSLNCFPILSMDIDEVLGQNLYLAPLESCVCIYKDEFTYMIVKIL